MQRERFTKVVEDVLDSLPEEFRVRIHNVAVLVEDLPPNQPSLHTWTTTAPSGSVSWCPNDTEKFFRFADGAGLRRALPEEHRGGLFQRGRNP